MKNRSAAFEEAFSDDDPNRYLKMNAFQLWINRKNRKIQLSALVICSISGITGSILLSCFLMYQALPLVWHWASATGTAFQNAFTWHGFLSALVTLYLAFAGLLPLILLSDTIHQLFTSLKNNAFQKDLHNRINEILKQPLYQPAEKAPAFIQSETPCS